MADEMRARSTTPLTSIRARSSSSRAMAGVRSNLASIVVLSMVSGSFFQSNGRLAFALLMGLEGETALDCICGRPGTSDLPLRRNCQEATTVMQTHTTAPNFQLIVCLSVYINLGIDSKCRY